jgi:cinA domain protein
VTGIAGPGGGSPEKPVGLVYIAASSKSGDISCQKKLFEGNRSQIRLQTVVSALETLIFAVEKG